MINSTIPASFSGANTGNGFISFYDTIFPEDQLTGLYIIKGGSGTGKSTFMRRLGERAVNCGHSVSHYLCGSDAESLDGIIIKGKRSGIVGVLDGTPPHPREFRSPGAAGDILNFGMFWDSKGLRKRRKDIDKLAKEKSVAFETAYRYLGAAEKIHSHMRALCQEAYLKDKAVAAAARLIDSIGVSGTVGYRQLIGFTMNGTVYLSPDSTTVREYRVMGNSDLASLFLYNVAEYVKLKGISVQISLSPIDLRSVDGIFFPESKVWLHIYNGDCHDCEKIINTRRFCDREKIGANRQKLRFGKKCREALLEGAFEAFDNAKEYHFELEEIYKEYMNFDALNEQSEIWYSEIMSRLD